MLLAIDVGNTQTVLGVYKGQELLHMWRLATNVDYTSDELLIKLHALLRAENLDQATFSGAVLASVVPSMTHNWEKACLRSFGIGPFVVSTELCGHLVGITGEDFRETGADRLADAVAAKALYGTPVVVVDFGTATNIEVVDAQGCFAGGIIAPGVESSMKSLLAHAALLKAVELEDPGVAIGRNTTDAIQVGVVRGEAARVDGLVEGVRAELGVASKVVATGGLAHRIAPMSQSITEINLELTLQGLRLIYEELTS